MRDATVKWNQIRTCASFQQLSNNYNLPINIMRLVRYRHVQLSPMLNCRGIGIISCAVLHLDKQITFVVINEWAQGIKQEMAVLVQFIIQ